MKRGVVSFDSDAYDAASHIAGNAGHPGLARDMARSMNSGSIEAIQIGQELIWLGKVLPSLARGNARLFLTTGTQHRRQLRAVWPIMEMIMQNNSGPFDPDYRQMFSYLGPILEHKVRIMITFFGQE